MPKLSYKTKGNSSPQGKPRVYFCCHPEDFEKYFDSVYEEITKEQNCAFYYDSEPDGEITEEWLSYLGEMQLFVIPVTTKFLTKENKGLSVEFPFAEEKHIPVLPLMQENGLDDIFSLKIGSLQYLNKYDTDKTGISYEEKLDKYLKSVLVGDELAQQIRDAFDAYIFLSYRKKDRVYAQQLMRLIHENEFCRDIAIWYDEFLTPGENFNASIEQALRKSRLFALAVTPNLVNEENYVMSVEYPMAKDAGKKILPAEVVKTDRDELEKKYEGIPACANAHNAPELSRALLKALSGIAVRENDGDPKHNFFIGLAYLSGIDVEVNHERALGLITSSAEAGLTEAMEKLVSMYRNGEGVARNYETAIEWQEKLVEVRRAEWEREQTEDSACTLCYALWKLGDYYKEMCNILLATKAYIEMMEAGQEAFSKIKSIRIVRYYGISCAFIGEFFMKDGRIKEAKELYEKYHEINELVLKETASKSARRDLIISYNKRGDLLKTEGKFAEARAMYIKGLEIGKSIFDETDTLEAKNDLSDSYERLGSAYEKEGYLDKANEAFSKALKIREEILAEYSSLEAGENVAKSCIELGDIARFNSDTVRAKALYQRSLEIREGILKETETIEGENELIISYSRLGDIFHMEGDLHKAKDMYLRCLQYEKKFCDRIGTLEAKTNLAVTLVRLADIYYAIGEVEDAKEMCRQVLLINDTISDEKKTLEWKRTVAACCMQIGNMIELEGNFDGAEAMYKRAFIMFKAIYEQSATAAAKNDLSVICISLGDFYKEKGDFSNAESLYLWALKISRLVFDEFKTNKSKEELAGAYTKLADLFKTEGEYEKAKELYLKEKKLREEIFAQKDAIGYKIDLYCLYFKIADLAESMGQLKEAMEFFSLATIIAESFSSQWPEDFMKIVPHSYNRLGKLFEAEGIIFKTREMYKKSLAICETIFNKTKSADAYDDLAFACYRVASVEDETLKLHYLQQAYEIWNHLSELCPDVAEYKRRRDIVAKVLFD